MASVEWSELSKEEKDRFKREALDDGLCMQLSALHRQGFLEGDESAQQAFFKIQFDPVWRAARALNQARYGRVTRLRKRVTDMILSGDAWFVTLTFRDRVLSDTSQETRRKYVRRYLKERTEFYVANIDFGDHHIYLEGDSHKVATGREHYHALVIGQLPVKVDENGRRSPDWPFGFSKQVRVRARDASVKKIPLYISKLTNHALKQSVGNTRYIYSKAVYKLPVLW